MSEVWKQIEDTDCYVSNLGRIKCDDEIKNTGFHKRNGTTVRIKYSDGEIRTKKVHILVAQAFIPNDNPRKKKQVHHINGDKSDNMVVNLKWASPSDTALRSLDKGKLSNTLREDDVRAIKELLSRDVPYENIASRFKISTGNVSQIKRGKSWRHVT